MDLLVKGRDNIRDAERAGVQALLPKHVMLELVHTSLEPLCIGVCGLHVGLAESTKPIEKKRPLIHVFLNGIQGVIQMHGKGALEILRTVFRQ